MSKLIIVVLMVLSLTACQTQNDQLNVNVQKEIDRILKTSPTKTARVYGDIVVIE